MAKKKEAYLSLSAMLRARETRLLNGERAARMLEAASFEDAVKLLTDCGYGELTRRDAAGLEELLSSRREALFREMENLAPEKGVVELFRVKYDTHNAKALLKAEAMGLDPKRLFSRCGRVPPEKLLEAYREERYSELPETFGKALAEARDLLARSANPQQADFLLDRACFREMLEIAAPLGNAFRTGYVRLLIDCANLKAAVRTLRMGKDPDFLREALIPGGSVGMDRVLAAGEGEAICALYQSGPLAKASACAAEALQGAPVTPLERACDNAVNTWLRSAKLVSYGPEALAAYLAAVEGEITGLRMILTGKLSGVAPETIRERLRDLYA